MNKSEPDEIVKCVLSVYNKLPKQNKPFLRGSGCPEWTVLASFVLSRQDDASSERRYHVASMGTGVKCLPHNKLPLKGDILHDSHAEVLARRGFIIWLHQQMNTSTKSEWLEISNSDPVKFSLADGVLLHLYISTLPCGDASTSLLSQNQDPSMAALKAASPVNIAAPQFEASDAQSALVRGRAGYEHLGAMRTKPGRADAPSSSSLSCSDKIASWMVTGVQGSLLSKPFEPVHIHQIVMSLPPSAAPEAQWHNASCRRAVWERIQSIAPRQSPKISFTDIQFDYSVENCKQTLGAADASQVASASEALSWVEGQDCEMIVNGIKKGSSLKRSPLAAQSRLSKAALFRRLQPQCDVS